MRTKKTARSCSANNPVARGVRVAWLGLAVSILAACGQAATSGTEPGCAILLSRDAQTPAAGSERNYTYTGTLNAACVDFVTSRTGSVTVKFAASGATASEVTMGDLRAGARSYSFGKTVTLASGIVNVAFGSASFPDWQLPWTDRPQTATATVNATANTPQSLLPTSMTLQLSL